MPTNEVPVRECASEDEFSLEALDKLVPNLGSSIERLIEKIEDYYDVKNSEKTIIDVLTAEGLAMADVFIDRGIEKGYNLKVAFERMYFNCMLSDRLSG